MAYLNFPYFRVRVDDDNFDSSQGSWWMQIHMPKAHTQGICFNENCFHITSYQRINETLFPAYI
jgi:hypothetical protein